MEEQNNDSAVNAKIIVIGIGGGGCNAVNLMITKEISEAFYVGVNTDYQALSKCKAPVKIQIGKDLTKGLGAGAIPKIGKEAAEENIKELEDCIKDADMVFLTCGLGGGTGTGAAPVIAKLCKERGILTVAVVTKPFTFENKPRIVNAYEGLKLLKEQVDTLLVVPNDRLLEGKPETLDFQDGLKLADEVLVDGVRSITDLIFNDGLINLDFGDIKTVMENKGIAHIGIGISKGSDGIMEALKKAINSPLLETDIRGAKQMILNCSGKISMKEMNTALCFISELTGTQTNIILGTVGKEEENIRVTLIATGLEDTENNKSIAIAERRRESYKQITGQNDCIKTSGRIASYNNTRLDSAKTKNQNQIIIPTFLTRYSDNR